MKMEADRWLIFADEDRRMARLALDEAIYNQVCFHSQQCVEKALKAAIISKGELPPRSHKIADLLAALEGFADSSLRKRLLLLDRFYIPTRYPDTLPGALPEGLPDRSDAETALNTAEELLESVRRLV